MTAEDQDESKKASKVSRRRFVTGVGAGAVVAAVAVAGAESILQSKSMTSVVTSTVPGPTTTVAGPTTTQVGPTTTVPGPTTTVAGPTTTQVGSTTTVPGPTTTVAGPTTTETSTVPGPTTTVAGPTTTETSTVTATAANTGFPIVKVANVSQLSVNSPIDFNYPLTDEPNMLVKLGQKAQGGVGPDGDIVAFSIICQHAGCTPSYVAVNPYASQGGPVAVCPCHGSVYDLINGGKVLLGPAPLPLPQVMLEVDSSGDIYAYAMGPPTIYGHNTGSNYVSADLQG